MLTVLVFSCTSTSIEEVNALSAIAYEPLGIGREVSLVYTDSGRVAAKMNTARLLDYSNQSYPYTEFPDGVFLELFEEQGDSIVRSTVTADYAILYDESNLIDLRDNVVLTTYDGKTLEGPQLYWNTDTKWMHTNRPYIIRYDNGSYNRGNQFDANEDFSIFLSRQNTGVQIIED